MRISIDAGHNCYPDSGASGFRVEDNLTKEVVSILIPMFNNAGHQTVDCTPYNQRFSSVGGSLGYRVRQANASGSDLHLCIHFNCGGGHGTECWISGFGGKSEEYAKSICSKISSLGYTNRGVKVGNLYVPKYTNMPCVLVEGAFVDSQEDMNRYNGQQIAAAIFEAVTGQQTSVPTTAPSQPQPVENVPVSDGSIANGVYYVAKLPYNLNAIVVNDFFYVRDKSGNVVAGRRVDINDKIIVLDISGSTQLAEVVYPTGNGYVHGYIKNVPANIKYMYQGQWNNGTTPEKTFQDSKLSSQIGSLNAHESATPLFRKDGHLSVVYNTSAGINTKSGFVEYNGGFTKF